jgi:hypothetical protein
MAEQAARRSVLRTISTIARPSTQKLQADDAVGVAISA